MRSRVVRTPDAAAYIGLTVSTLEKMRIYGGGPRFVKITARAVGYTVDDLDAYIEAGRRQSTSDDGTGLSGLSAGAPSTPQPSKPTHKAKLTQPIDRPSSRHRGKQTNAMPTP